MGAIPLFYGKLACNRRKLKLYLLHCIAPPLKCTDLAGTTPLVYHRLACNRRELSYAHATLGPLKMHLLGGDTTSLLSQTCVQTERAKQCLRRVGPSKMRRGQYLFFMTKLVCDRKEPSSVYTASNSLKMHRLGRDNTSTFFTTNLCETKGS